jgi:opacity protein-like surface antigen
MKKLLVMVTLVSAIASPAMARPVQHHAAQWNSNYSSAANAFGQAGVNVRGQSAASRGHIIVNGNDEGTDPDPLVRMELRRDPPNG